MQADLVPPELNGILTGKNRALWPAMKDKKPGNHRWVNNPGILVDCKARICLSLSKEQKHYGSPTNPR